MQLAAAGADIVLNDLPNAPGLEETAAEIRRLGRDAFVFGSDAFSREGCEAIVEEAVRVAGHIDILVSSPSYSRRAGFLDYPAELWQRMLDSTLSPGFHLSQLVARHMVARRIRGKITFISSVQANMPAELCLGYCTAKAGLNQMMRNIAVELTPHRINVNAIEPGWIDTPKERETFTEELLASEGAKLPWGRIGVQVRGTELSGLSTLFELFTYGNLQRSGRDRRTLAHHNSGR